MDLLGIKRRKELKAQHEAEERRQKEMQTKIRIRRTLNNMKSQSAKLEAFKKDYIDKAREALKIGNKNNYNLAKQGLRLCLSKQRFLDAMISNFEIALQTNEMNKIINEFVTGINMIANEMSSLNSGIDITKAQMAYESALAQNESQYDALEAFMAETQAGLESFAGREGDVAEEELDRMIGNEAVQSESEQDEEIERKIQNIKAEIGGR